MKTQICALLFSAVLYSNHAIANSHEHSAGVAPEQALSWLKNGNQRYLKGHQRNDGKTQEDRARLTKGQHPHTIVLSCSDSRVPPELVFDQALGEIFTIRVAGEALDSSVIASIEYAVEHLGTRLVVVMGHTACGAVKAALATAEGKSAGSPSLDKLVADIKPRLKDRAPASEPSPEVELESAKNASTIAKDLLARSQIIKHKVQSGEVKIQSALYYIDSGKVKFH